MKTVQIAFFDVDHTITRRATGSRFAVTAVKNGIVKARYLLTLPFLYIAYRAGKLSPSKLNRNFAALRGLHRDDLEKIAASTFEKQIKGDIFLGALELIAALKKNGSRIVLATSALDIVARKVADFIKADELIASALEFDGDITTGCFLGNPAFGPAKLELARGFALRSGISLSDCAFYSDSIHDLPLLLEVGKPVAVNPDTHLIREAHARGWEIIRFR